MHAAEEVSPSTTPADLGRLTSREWGLLLVLAAIQFTNIIDFMIVMPLGPQFMRELHLSPAEFSWMVAVYGFSAAITGLLAAWFIDRFDRKLALLVLYAGFTTSTVFCAVAPNFAALLLARTVAGGFGGVAGSTVLAIVGDAFPDIRRGRATGVVMSAFSLASIFGVPIGLWLAELSCWRAPFAYLGGLCAVILLCSAVLLPSMRGHLLNRFEKPSTLGILLDAGHQRAYLLMIALVLGTFTVVPYIASYLVANCGRSESELPLVYLCGGLATLVSLQFVGRLSDRFGKLRLFRIFALVTVIPLLWVTHLPQVSLTVALTATTFFMVASSGRMVPAMALMTACVRPGSRGSFMSINASLQQLSAGLASLLTGAMLVKTADGSLSGFGTVGWLAAASMIASVWLAGRLRPVEGREAVPYWPKAAAPQPIAEELLSA
jgi:predicted MFS family arabinose efflux permease